MICFLAISLFLAHTYSLFDNNLIKIIGSTFGKANTKRYEYQALYYFSQADFNNARGYAKLCIKTSGSSRCSALLNSINDYELNEKQAALLISRGRYTQALKHISICQAIAKKYTKQNSPLSVKINKMYMLVLYSQSNAVAETGMIDNIISKLSDKVDKIGDYLDGFGNYLDGFGNYLDGFGNYLDGFGNSIDNYIEKIDGYVEKIGDFIDNIF